MKKRTVLVVDDDRINRAMLCEILENEYRALQAENGRDALACIREKQDCLSAVLITLILPEMDGYEVLRAMRAEQLLARIPVIVTAQQEGADSEIRAFSLGVADFLNKPYHPEIIRHRLANIIRLHESAALADAAERDSLTGLLSQTAFNRRAAERLREEKTTPYDLLVMDIDRLQMVNDLFGVHEGDRLLCFAGEILHGAVPGGAVCARTHGGHFAVLLPRVKDSEEALVQNVVEKLRSYPISMPVFPKFGVFCADDRTIPVTAMCDRALLAAETIKGRYGVYMAQYQESMRDRLLEEQQIENDMRAALEEKQFRVRYQPKFDLATGLLTGAEALVRWEHPQKGTIMPDKFIPLFERNGFITQLDRYVWDMACADLERWQAMSQAAPVSVNVSRADFYDPQLISVLVDTVGRHHLRPVQLHLEITETAYMQNPAQLIDTVEQLKKLGFHIEMDDFGSGYSSLNMLSDLPIDTLKLDMHFLRCKEDKRCNDVLTFAVSLAKWLGVNVIAEGVETAEQVQLLHDLGCNSGQGYYFSRPVPAAEYEKQLRGGAGWRIPLRTETADAVISMEELWNPMSSFNRIFDSFIGVLAIYEFTGTELLFVRANEKYYQPGNVLRGRHISGEQSYSVLQYVHPADEERLLASLCRAAERGGEFIEDIRLRGECFTDRYRWQHMQFKVINRTGYRTLFLACMEDITDTKQNEKKLIEAAKKDAMTGLLNRVAFEEDLNLRVRPANERHRAGIFLILDVDNFKQINDTGGHQRGDAVIVAVSSVLRKVVRADDLVARLGGDEFAIFMHGVSDRKIAATRAEELCHRVESLDTVNRFSCSIGIAMCPECGSDFVSLYRAADEALYGAKKQGKNKYRFAQGMRKTAE